MSVSDGTAAEEGSSSVLINEMTTFGVLAPVRGAKPGLLLRRCPDGIFEVLERTFVERKRRQVLAVEDIPHGPFPA